MFNGINSKKIFSTAVLIMLGLQALSFFGASITAIDGTSPAGSRVAETGYWTTMPNMSVSRYDHTMHLFENDSIIVIGGFDGFNALDSIEIYDPFMGTWLNGTSMHVARWAHASVTLTNKTILVVGGYDAAGNPLKSAELYDTQAALWYTLEDLPFASGGANLSVTLLNNGSVLVVGGNAGPASAPNVQAMATIYDAATSDWSTIALPPSMAMGRQSFRLLNNTVMAVGGSSGSPWYGGKRFTEVFNTTTKTWSQMGNLTMGRFLFDGVLLDSGQVLVAGGIRQLGPGYDVVSTTEVFNSTTLSWDNGPSMVEKRYGLTADLLPDSEVLLAGGLNATSVQNSTEIVMLKKGKSIPAQPMHEARAHHASVKTLQGHIVVTGGIGASGPLASVESFTPGVKQDLMNIELFGLDQVQSEGDLEITAHVYNDTTGDLSGALVTFSAGNLGSFDVEGGLTDAQGVIGTVYHAPRNTMAHPMSVTITVSADHSGYKETMHVLQLDVFPETRGEPMGFNDSIDHLAYVTVFSEGSTYSPGSHIHSGSDFLGDEQVFIDGQQILAANFSFWETTNLTFDLSGMTHIVVSEMIGHYYFEYLLEGTVYAFENRTTRSLVFNQTYEDWLNITEESVTRYLPAMRGINTSMDQLGMIQDVVNTYETVTKSKNLDTGVEVTSMVLRSVPKSYVFNGVSELATLMGLLTTNVFIDETGRVFESYSPELGILVEATELNDTGVTSSNKVLLEYNDIIGEDPTSPLLSVEMAALKPSLFAGTSTKVRLTVTCGEVPVENATIDVFAPQGGTIGPAQVMTGPDGRTELTFDADTGSITKQLNITVLATKIGYRQGYAKTSITIVQDSSAPAITHRELTETGEAKPLEIYALVYDNVNVKEVRLNYRMGQSGDFMSLPMELYLGAYMASIPSGVASPPLIEYYITAKDINGNLAFLPDSAPAGPFQVQVIARLRTLPAVSTILEWGGTATVFGAIRGNLTLTISKVNDPTTGTQDPRFMGLFAEVRSVGNGQLVWANISFNYNDYLLDHLKESELKIYWYDATAKNWSAIQNTGVLADKHIVWANVTHLTIFAPRASSQPVFPPEPDIILPEVVIKYPVNKAALNQGIVHIIGQASDAGGLFSVQVSLDNGVWIDVWVTEGAKSADWVFDLALGPGEHIISARAKDQAGNIGNETSIVVSVVKKETVGDGITMRVVLSAAAALLVVIIVVVAMLLVSSTSEQRPKAQKKAKYDDEPGLDDEEVDEEE